MMQDAQDSIIRHNFVQSLPKSIMDIIEKIDDASDKKLHDGGREQNKLK